MTGRIIGIRTVRTEHCTWPTMVTGAQERIEGAAVSETTGDVGGLVYMVIDCSASMAGDKMGEARKGILEFAGQAMRKRYSLGVIKFDSSAARVCELRDTADGLASHLDKLEANGSTNMADGIALAHSCLAEGTCSRRVMVVATDGRPDSTRAALKAGQTAKDDGIEIIAIGTGDADLAFLQKLATGAEQGSHVPSEQFAKAISSAHLFLPSPGQIAWDSLSACRMIRSQE